MQSIHRRAFVFGTAATALGRSAFARSASDTIGTAMIGTGNRGQYVLESVLGQPGVKVLALCDLKPDRVDKAATIAGRDKPNTYTDYRKMLERKDLDAVFVCTPCDLHVEMSIAALKAGKHVYCEKPVGITPDSVRELVRVARASKTVFQVGQQMRSESRLRKTIEKIHEGGVGKIVMVKAQRHAGDDLAHDGSSAEWFFNASRSGDVIVEMSVHNLDVCNWVIASYPERAAGFGGTLVWVNDPPGRTNMDGYTLSYEYANGVKMSYIQTFFHPNGMPGGGQFFNVYTTEGGVDLLSATFYPRAKGGKPVVLAPPEPPEKREMAHVAAFYAAIRGGTKPFADITVGASGALTAIMGREAIYKKKVATWSEMGVEL
jgi:predicted dehydrogenase